MKKIITLLIILGSLFITVVSVKGQAVTVTNPAFTTPALSATYTSLANAVTALNGITSISGLVTITLNSGNSQTAPAGGYVINFTAATSATNRVIITGNNNIITASASLVSGTLTDGIFKLIGVDYVTIENFTMRENPLNVTTAAATNNMTEWGVALLYASATNGAQNNRIQNNTISLNKTYSNTFGIYSNTRHTASVTNITAEVTSTAGANSLNRIYGNAISNVNMGIAMIGSGDAAYMDLGNDIGGSALSTGNTITNWGGLAAASIYIGNSGTCYGVFINNQKSETVAFNTITSASVSGTAVTMRGIFKTYSVVPTGSFTSGINANVITINHGFSSGTLDGIRSEGISSPLSTANINIISNRFQNVAVTAVGSSTTFVGIINTSQCGVLNINNNIFRGNTSAATTGGFTAISNSGAVQTTLTINGNQIGDASGDAISFSAATSGSLVGITCASLAAGAALSISNNNFQGFVQSVAGSGLHSYIGYVHAPNAAITDNINNNSFTNLVANTSGSVTFISRSGAMAVLAGATENCNNNSIVTGFSKPVAGGTVALYNAGSGSLSGNSMVQTGNNFSNITITGATVLNGWNNTEGGLSGPAKTISGNTFGNWVCGSGTVTVIRTDFSDNNTTVNNNTISNISAAAAVTGISIGSNNKGTVQSCSGNAITGLSSTGAGTVLGIFGGSVSIITLNINNNTISNIASNVAGSFSAIRMFTAATANIFKNKIYDIRGTGVSSLVNGIDVQSAAAGAYNIYNNLIGDLTAAITNSLTAVRGISLLAVNAGNAYNVYYNTVYINASSSAVNFGTAAFSASASATAANGTLSLRNNIFVNTSAAAGSGLTMAYRRSSIDVANFANSSNNNIFYAGTPSASNVIFSDGTNNDQTLAAYKTRVGPARDAASFTELPPFLSTVGSNTNFLHLNPNAVTQAESGAVNIATYTDDVDGDIRQGNPGYAGFGTAPDIGADEIALETTPPAISYTTISSPICIFSGMTISGVVIKDSSGVPLTGTLVPRIYFRKNAGAWFSAAGVNTGGVAKNSTWKFTIAEGSMGGVVVGDVVSYYIIAQDIVPVPNVGASPGAGLVASNVNTVTTAPTSPSSYTISGSLNGLYTVGIGGNFTTINAAFNAYNNACSLAGPVIFELTDNEYPEDAEAGLVNHPDASPVNTLTIRPSATATPVLNFTTTFASGIPGLWLFGARYVTFDGRQSGTGSTKSMTINNPGGGVTILFSENAQNNTIKYCIIQGSCSSTAAGTILFGNAAATGTGNDNNTIDNNDITDPGNGFFSTYGIYSVATSTRGNDSMVISNNHISNYYNATSSSAGIYLTSTYTPVHNSRDWTISGNRLFQTATRLYTVAADHYGIKITGGAGFTISNNVIGFANATGTGTTNMIGNSSLIAGFPTAYNPAGTSRAIRYRGIFITSGYLLPVSNIDGNTIGGIAMYTSSNSNSYGGIFSGIYQDWDGTANIGMNTGNTIGSSTQTNSIYIVSTTSGGMVTGIFAYYFYVSPLVYVQKNMIGGILVSGASDIVGVGITGIESNAYAIEAIVSENIIGNSIPGNLRAGYAVDGGGLLSINGTLQACTGGSTAITGIIAYGFGSVDDNTLQGWATSNTGGAVIGIQTSIASATNNKLGTAVLDWINYPFANSGALTGIDVVINAFFASIPLNISNNKFRSVAYAAGATNTGACNFILLTGSTASGRAANITDNDFINLSLKASSVNLINTSNKMSASGRRTIENNKITGSLSVTAANGNLTMIRCEGDPAAGSISAIRNNDFSNVSISSSIGFSCTGIYCIETNAAANGYSTKKITGNTLSDWSANIGEISGMLLGCFGSVAGSASSSDSVANNAVSNLSTGEGSIMGIQIDYPSLADTIRMVENTIAGISSASLIDGNGSAGILIQNNSAGNKLYIKRNTVHTINVTGPQSVSFGILALDGNNEVEINSNKVYDIAGADAQSYTAGIGVGLDQLGFVSGDANNDISIYNNMVGGIKAPAAGVVGKPSVMGIDIVAGSNISVVHNTVYLDASSTSPLFSSAAVYTHTNPSTTNIRLTHNLFVNLSIPGTSGKTVVHWRESNNLTNFSIGGTFANSYSAGSPAANRLIYFDGTNSLQGLAAYLATVTPRESGTVSEIPVFLSTIGSSTAYLHLNPIGNCGLIQKVFAGFDVATDFDGDIRKNFPQATDIGADEVAKTNNWTGTNSTSWSNAFNWSLGTVPNGLEYKVFIPVTVNQPVIDVGETFQVTDLYMSAGATLLNRGMLKIAGNFSIPLAGSINNTNAGVVTGSVEINAPCNSKTINGDIFSGNAVKDFRIGTDVSISGIAGKELRISGELGFDAVSSKTFTTNNNVVLVSTAAGTANVGIIENGNAITGEITVERFIPARRSWRLLTAPLNAVATTTISQAWQDGQQAATIPPPAYTPGSGTLITNGTVAANGYDKGSTSNPSIKFYNGTAWVAPANTNVLPVKTHPGYMLFVRGDRNISIGGTGVAANTTTLRPKNIINTGTQTINNAVGTGFQVVGNPFPSAINFHTTNKTGLGDIYRLWDPRIGGLAGVGGFVTFAWNSLNNNYDRTVTGAGSSALPQDGTIESGAAFIVNFTGPGNLQIKETDKVSTSAAAPFGRPLIPSAAEGRLTVNLGFKDTDGSLALLDGVLVTYHPAYNNQVDQDDALKMKNTEEDFGLSSGGKIIAIERRQPIRKNDTLFFAFTQPKARTYQLQLIPVQLAMPGLTAFIEDQFTHTKTEISLSDTSYYSFTASAGSAGSYAPDRLMLVFSTTSVGPAESSYVQLQAAEQGSQVLLDWQAGHDYFTVQYEIEKSANGTDFRSAAAILSNGSGLYQWLDQQPSQGNNFYRIKKTGSNGEVEYSNVTVIRMAGAGNWAHVYPNPVTDGLCNLHISSKDEGMYAVRIINSLGQLIFNTMVRHTGVQSRQPLQLPANTPPGIYQLELTNKENGRAVSIPVLIKNN